MLLLALLQFKAILNGFDNGSRRGSHSCSSSRGLSGRRGSSLSLSVDDDEEEDYYESTGVAGDNNCIYSNSHAATATASTTATATVPPRKFLLVEGDSYGPDYEA